jgi:hypothetical protein
MRAESANANGVTGPREYGGIGRIVCAGSQSNARGGGKLTLQYRKALGWRSRAREGGVAGAAFLLVVVNASAAMSGRFFRSTIRRMYRKGWM